MDHSIDYGGCFVCLVVNIVIHTPTQFKHYTFLSFICAILFSRDMVCKRTVRIDIFEDILRKTDGGGGYILVGSCAFFFH